MTPKGKILIADDDDVFLQVTSDLLKREHYEFTCVGDGAAAADLLRREAFDLMICDIGMPGNKDLELIRNLPAEASGMPIILATGNPTLDSAIESVHLSVMAYLVKPFNTREFYGWVEKLVEYSRVCRSGNEVYERLSGWTSELKGLRQYMMQNPRTTRHFPVGNFISLTISNMLGSILDLKGLVEGMSDPQSERDVCQLYDCPRLEEHRQVIQECIKVLEKTKSSFKSKELSELRHYLESFIQSKG